MSTGEAGGGAGNIGTGAGQAPFPPALAADTTRTAFRCRPGKRLQWLPRRLHPPGQPVQRPVAEEYPAQPPGHRSVGNRTVVLQRAINDDRWWFSASRPITKTRRSLRTRRRSAVSPSRSTWPRAKRKPPPLGRPSYCRGQRQTNRSMLEFLTNAKVQKATLVDRLEVPDHPPSIEDSVSKAEAQRRYSRGGT